MPRYEIKCFAVVRADTEEDAQQLLSAALANLADGQGIEYAETDDASPLELEDDE